MPIPVLTLRQSLILDAESGALTWKERPVWHFANDMRWSAQEAQARWNTRYAGTAAFTTLSKAGYLTGVVDGERLFAHRVIMAMRLGSWPPETVDHINGVRNDNRLSNLRLASRSEQSRNTSSANGSTSQYLGVSYRKDRDVWRAVIFIDGRQKYLGSFTSEIDAAKAYDVAAREHFKEFARCNFP
jgi:hypothetical protein